LPVREQTAPECGTHQHRSIRYSVQQNWVEAEKEAYEQYRPRLGDFDIVHDHSWYGWPYIAKTENPSLSILHTHHGHLNWKTPPPFRYPNLVEISQYSEKTKVRIVIDKKANPRKEIMLAGKWRRQKFCCDTHPLFLHGYSPTTSRLYRASCMNRGSMTQCQRR